MSKIIVREGNVVKTLDSEPFVYEALLESSIAEIPELIPLNVVSDEANNFATLGTQWPAGGGAADVLMLASDAVLTIVETKLKKNPESRREVVAQVIEYAAYLSSWSLAEIIARAGEAYKAALDKLGIGPEQVAEFESRIEDNLRGGRIRLVVAVDELGEQILRLITFLNANSKFDIFLLEVKAFKNAGVDIFIPTLHGYANKSSSSSTTPTQRWTEERFLEDLRSNGDSELVAYTTRVYEQFKHWTQEPLWGSGATFGSFNVVLLLPGGRLNIAQITSRGILYVHFGNMVSREVPRPIIDRLHARLSAIEGVALPGSIDNRYPPIASSALRDTSRLDLVLSALEAFIQEVSAT